MWWDMISATGYISFRFKSKNERLVSLPEVLAAVGPAWVMWPSLSQSLWPGECNVLIGLNQLHTVRAEHGLKTDSENINYLRKWLQRNTGLSYNTMADGWWEAQAPDTLHVSSDWPRIFDLWIWNLNGRSNMIPVYCHFWEVLFLAMISLS